MCSIPPEEGTKIKSNLMLLLHHVSYLNSLIVLSPLLISKKEQNLVILASYFSSEFSPFFHSSECSQCSCGHQRSNR